MKQARRLILLLLFVPATLLAQLPTLTVEQAECLPAEGNGVIIAQVGNEPPASAVRIFFRRLHAETEDFYYVLAHPVGNGGYRAVLPRVEKRQFRTAGERQGWGEQWRRLDESEDRGERAQKGMFETRDWLHNLDDEALQTWLAGLDDEPVEYFAALVDPAGSRLARSQMRVAEVRQDCAVTLSDRERGKAENLTVGETAPWQAQVEVFHWQCFGLVTRIDPLGVPKADPFCRDSFPSRWPGDDEIATRSIPAADGTQTFKTVRVLFGTDRKREFATAGWKFEDGSRAYGGRRGPLDLGTCDVSIPFDHEEGVLEAPGFFEKADPAKHVLLLSVDPKPQQIFIDELRQRVAQSEGKVAAVFVHGYNVSFENAARRTAQMAHDLDYDGAPMFYSWPSQASIKAYPVDEANVRRSVPHLMEFLRLVARESEADSIHLIAHSMGNRALTEALRRFAFEEPASDRPRFDEVVLVAPDIDAEVFTQELAPAILEVGRRITLYASAEDKALLVSGGIHGHPRAGDLSEGIVLADGVETVDATRVDTSLLRAINLGHSYFADKATVISDLRSLLAGVEISAREHLVRTTDAAAAYWRFIPVE